MIQTPIVGTTANLNKRIGVYLSKYSLRYLNFTTVLSKIKQPRS